MHTRLFCSLLFLSLLSSNARASLLNFETTPSGSTPVDDAALSAPYTISEGTVRFYFDTNGNNSYDSGTDALPQFERIGDDATNGFSSSTGIPDTALPGYESQLGTYFLRAPAGLGGAPPGPFIAHYSTVAAIKEFSGEVWDIDGGPRQGTEQWLVEVLDHAGQILAQQFSPIGSISGLNSLDSRPWVFEFRNLPVGVEDVRLTFVGTRTSGVGLAFNNFSPTVAVPEPSSLLLGIIAALCASTIYCHKRRR